MNTLSNPFFLAFKAALAAALAYAIVNAFGVYDTLSAPFVALACTSPVVVTGLRLGLYQIIASAIGGVTALVVLLVFPKGALALGVAIFITLYAVHRFRLHDVFLVAGFTVIYAYLLPGTEADFAVEHRMLSVVAGVVGATVVNTAVSAGAYRSIFRRRRRLLAGLVGQGLQTLAKASGNRGEAFDAVFPLLWPLQTDLADACREGRWRRMRNELPDVLDAVRLLGLLSHLGKELGLLSDASPAQATLLRPHLEALSAMFETGASAPFPPDEHEWSGPLRRAQEACRSIKLLEARLDSAGTTVQASAAQ